MSYYREMVKDMDDSQKLELVSIIIDSLKQITPISTEQPIIMCYNHKRNNEKSNIQTLDARRSDDARPGIV